MNGYSEFGRILIILGLMLLVIGLIVTFIPRMPFNLFKLPGDIYYEKDGFRFYFPVVTSILLSVILTLILNLIFYFVSRK